MTGILIPDDRSIKQQAVGYCMNPECFERSDAMRFEFPVEHSNFECPKCGASMAPFVGILVITHLLVRDKAGPLIGESGLRYKLACDSRRAYIATASNLEAGSGEVAVVNCPGCLAAKAKEKYSPINGHAIYAKK